MKSFSPNNQLFTVLVVLMILINSITITSSKENPTTLKDLNGKVFRIYKIKRIRPPPNEEGIIKYNELNDWLTHVIYLITNDPFTIVKHLKLKGYSLLGDEKIYIYEYDSNNTHMVIAIGDLGHFYIRIGNGETGTYQTCNISFGNYFENIRSAIRGRLPDKPGILEIKWAGQYGDRTAYAIIGQICTLTNNTTACYTPSNQTTTRILYNPYEVYYIYLQGYRIEPPIKVRCSNPKYTNGFSAVYVEGFIPALRKDYFYVRINDEYLYEILSIIEKTGLNVSDYDELVVDDIYLALTENESLAPILVLQHKNTKFLIVLEEHHPVLELYGSFSNPSEENNSINTISIDWNSVFSKQLNTGSKTESYMDLFPYLGITIIALVLIILLRKRIRRKQ